MILKRVIHVLGLLAVPHLNPPANATYFFMASDKSSTAISSKLYFNIINII